jgi:hypothetical protein
MQKPTVKINAKRFPRERKYTHAASIATIDKDRTERSINFRPESAAKSRITGILIRQPVKATSTQAIFTANFTLGGAKERFTLII